MAKQKKSFPVQESLMTLSDVAKYLQVAERTVYLWAQQNSMPSFKLGNVWRFRRTDLDRWIEERKQQTPRNSGAKSADQ